MNKAWVLTCEVNEYDQAGEYFVSFFFTKPTKEALKTVLLESDFVDSLSGSIPDVDSLVDHVTHTGDRQGLEYLWFHLREVEEGRVYF